MIFALVIAACLLLILAALLFMILPSFRSYPDMDAMGRYVAHRGLHGLKPRTPENSLAAFGEAIKRGYAIEIDIHITSDGEVVVFHDGDLRRMCGVEGKIGDMTLKELKKLRLKDSDEQIPTLKECLELVSGSVPLLVEFKCSQGNYKKLCVAADKILRDYQGVYFMQSFFSPAVGWYWKNRPDVCRGQLSENFGFGGKKCSSLNKMLSLLMFNYMCRPNFVSYNHRDARFLMRRVVTRLGAYPIGWTFRSQVDIDKARNDFKVFIFEGFIPEE